MNFKNMDYQTQKKVLANLGEKYRRAHKRMDIFTAHQRVEENWMTYDADMQLVHLIDRALLECSNDAKNIIRHVYLENHPCNWYALYYSKSAYYRKHQKAVKEFFKNIDI